MSQRSMSVTPVTQAPTSAAGGFLRAPDKVSGWITYVGMGLGDPGLMTLAGAQAVREATVIAVDDATLVARLREFDVLPRPDARIIELNPQASPSERAATIVAALRYGETLVRLTVGDPLADADLGPEASACLEGGGEVAMLPAVSGVTAAPTLAGFYGRSSCATRYVRLADNSPSWENLRVDGPTLVDCAVERLGHVAETALASGHTDDELVLVVAEVGTQHESSWTPRLGELAHPEAAPRNPVPGAVSTTALAHLAPTCHVIIGLGEAARRDVRLDYAHSRPLLGWRVLVPRARETCRDLTRRLERFGASVATLDTLSLEPPRNQQPMDRAIRGVVDGRYRWVVFASTVATRVVLDTVGSYGLDARAFSGVRLAAASPMSRELLGAHGLIPDVAAAVPGRAGASLVEVFPEYDAQTDPLDRVLVPVVGLTGASPVADGLRQLGWRVDEVVVCRTVRAAAPPVELRTAIKSGRFDAVVFTSPTAVRNLLGLAGKPSAGTLLAAIGQAAAETCRAAGLTVAVTAPEPGCRELAGALAQYAAQHRA